jgi:Spy/CpxP family protein refolding chaperone
LIATTAFISLSAAIAAAQAVIQIAPNNPQQVIQSTANQDDEMISAVFDPITDDLKLTPTQKFRIVAIATATMARAEPLFDKLDELDAQMSVAAFTGKLDEVKLKQISAKQGALLSEIIAMKSRAKASFYKILTAEQRSMVVDQYRVRSGENSLGSISY